MPDGSIRSQPARTLGRVEHANQAQSYREALSRQEDIRQRRGHERSRGVLGQSAVARLVESPQPLDDAEHVFDSGADPRLGTIAPSALAWIRVLSGVRAVAPDGLFLAMQQIGQGMLVVNVGSGDDGAVRQARVAGLSNSCRSAVETDRQQPVSSRLPGGDDGKAACADTGSPARTHAVGSYPIICAPRRIPPATSIEKRPLEPDPFRAQVMSRVSGGRWHPRSVLKRMRVGYLERREAIKRRRTSTI